MELQIIIALNGLIGVLNAFYAAKNHREFTNMENCRHELQLMIALRAEERQQHAEERWQDQEKITRLEYKVATLEQRTSQLEQERVALLTQIARMANGRIDLT